MQEWRRLIVIGAGGFGPEVVWAVQNMNADRPAYDILGFCDDDPSKRGAVVYGLPVLGAPESVAQDLAVPPFFLCAVGRNVERRRVVERALALGWRPATVIDPSVTVAKGVTVGAGSYVGAGSILSPHSSVGNHVIINHHCSIGHDSVVEDFSQVSPGGRVSGGSVLREGALIGSNAAVAPGCVVGRYAVVGACSFAMRNVPDGETVVGVPARAAIRRA